MEDLDLLERAFYELRSDLEKIEETAKEEEKQYALGRLHGITLALVIVDAFIKEEKQKRLLITYKGLDG
jgi:hypothetical protein